jgi:hypothetical protein
VEGDIFSGEANIYSDREVEVPLVNLYLGHGIHGHPWQGFTVLPLKISWAAAISRNPCTAALDGKICHSQPGQVVSHGKSGFSC